MGADFVIVSPIDEIIDEMQDIIRDEVHRLKNAVRARAGGPDPVHGVERTMKMMAEALLLTQKCRAVAEAADGVGELTSDQLRERMLADPDVIATLQQANKTLASH